MKENLPFIYQKDCFPTVTSMKRGFKFTFIYGKIMLQEKKLQLSPTSFLRLKQCFSST